MSAAGPSQGARPPGGERGAAPHGGEHTKTLLAVRDLATQFATRSGWRKLSTRVFEVQAGESSGCTQSGSGKAWAFVSG